MRRLLKTVCGDSVRLWDLDENRDPLEVRRDNVLVVLTGGIGDTVMGIPFLSVLKEFWPGVKICVLTTELNIEVLRSRPEIFEFVFFPERRDLRSMIRVGRHLRGIGFDLMVGLLPTNLRSHALLAKLLGAPVRLKHKHYYADEDDDFQFWYTDLVPLGDGEHVVCSNLALLRPLGIDTSGLAMKDIQSRLRILLTEDERHKAHQKFPRTLSGSLRVGFHAGAKPGWEFKAWDPNKFSQLATLIGRKLDAEIVWFGGDREVSLVKEIMANMSYPSRSFVGQLPLRGTAAMIAGCDLFISNDSGLMHTATAVDVPTIGLFGSDEPRNDPIRTGPFGERHIVVRAPNLHDVMVHDVYASVKVALETGLSDDGLKLCDDSIRNHE